MRTQVTSSTFQSSSLKAYSARCKYDKADFPLVLQVWTFLKTRSTFTSTQRANSPYHQKSSLLKCPSQKKPFHSITSIGCDVQIFCTLERWRGWRIISLRQIEVHVIWKCTSWTPSKFLRTSNYMTAWVLRAWQYSIQQLLLSDGSVTDGSEVGVWVKLKTSY